MIISDIYKFHIYDIYKNFKLQNISDLNNIHLSKIFEYYSCIYLYKKFNNLFYVYEDISPDFKELNNLPNNDIGIDCCDLKDTIVQCKLRKNNLTWKECSTFFSSSISFDNITKKNFIKWPNLILCRNSNSNLSNNLIFNKNLFNDITIDIDTILNYCEELYNNPPRYNIDNNQFILRNYQLESINLINNTNDNLVINLPTGTGKNCIIINSLIDDKKYLILVPRIILMYQIKNEILYFKPYCKNKIQLLGDNKLNYDPNINITICVYNSINKISNFKDFYKIYIDESHHLYKPILYYNDVLKNDDIIYLEPQDFSDYIPVENKSNQQCIENKFNEDIIYDEIDNQYIKQICELSKFKNNIYLSATIDEIPNFKYYSKDIREMINNKYLCDYNINVPIFSNNINSKIICEYLLKNYKNIIIYCNSRKIGIDFNKNINNIIEGISEYVDCKTPKNKLQKILTKFKNGQLLFLVNVRILTEGFDAPITKGVCFINMPSSKTNIIQIIGRSLRLHPLKTLANVILPYSKKDDETHINKFLSILANNDVRIKNSYNNKKLGGYINIKVISNTREEIDEENNYIFTKIYDSLGNSINYIENWYKRYNELLEYINKHKNLPKHKDKDKKVSSLRIWFYRQKNNYINKKESMENPQIYDIWTKFKINYENIDLNFIQKWYKKYKKLLKYIKNNNLLPSEKHKNFKIKKLGMWVSCQKRNYKNKTKSMNNPELYNIWTKFINDNKKLFLNDIQKWYKKFKELTEYIKKNKSYKNIKKELCKWFYLQKLFYKNKTKSMNNPELYNIWTKFINDNKKLFINKIEIWYKRYNEVLCYINKYNKLPSQSSNDKYIKSLGMWISTQKQNYKNKKKCMKISEIHNTWIKLIKDYNQLF
jgi:hypothetical protein